MVRFFTQLIVNNMKNKIFNWIIIIISITSLFMTLIPNITLDKIIFFPTLSIGLLSRFIKDKILRYIILILCLGILVFIYFHWYV